MRSLTRSMGAAAVLETAADTPPTIIRLQSAGHLFHRCNSRSISALAATIPLLQFGENCKSLGELRYVLKKSTTNPCYHSFMLASRFCAMGNSSTWHQCLAWQAFIMTRTLKFHPSKCSLGWHWHDSMKAARYRARFEESCRPTGMLPKGQLSSIKESLESESKLGGLVNESNDFLLTKSVLHRRSTDREGSR